MTAIAAAVTMATLTVAVCRATCWADVAESNLPPITCAAVTPPLTARCPGIALGNVLLNGSLLVLQVGSL